MRRRMADGEESLAWGYPPSPCMMGPFPPFAPHYYYYYRTPPPAYYFYPPPPLQMPATTSETDISSIVSKHNKQASDVDYYSLPPPGYYCQPPLMLLPYRIMKPREEDLTKIKSRQLIWKLTKQQQELRKQQLRAAQKRRYTERLKQKDPEKYRMQQEYKAAQARRRRRDKQQRLKQNKHPERNAAPGNTLANTIVARRLRISEAPTCSRTISLPATAAPAVPAPAAPAPPASGVYSTCTDRDGPSSSPTSATVVTTHKEVTENSAATDDPARPRALSDKQALRTESEQDAALQQEMVELSGTITDTETGMAGSATRSYNDDATDDGCLPLNDDERAPSYYEPALAEDEHARRSKPNKARTARTRAAVGRRQTTRSNSRTRAAVGRRMTRSNSRRKTRSTPTPAKSVSTRSQRTTGRVAAAPSNKRKKKRRVMQQAKTPKYPVGTYVGKYFESECSSDEGWFVGEVVSWDGEFYQIRYEDGDEEEFDEADMDTYVVH